MQHSFLLFECSLDFYNCFRVFLLCWIRKCHPFLSIRSVFFFLRGWFEKKSDLLIKSIKFLWHYQLIFVNTYPKYVFKRKNVLPRTHTDYLIEKNYFYNAPHIETCEQKRTKWHVTIALKLNLNQCNFWIQCIKFVLNQLKKRRQQFFCWSVKSTIYIYIYT